MDRQYSKLNKAVEYDQEAAEELAEALNEIVALEARVESLKELVNENSELHPFIWRTAEDKAIAFHLIESDHFRNILQHKVNHRSPLSKELKAEARKRGVTIPTHYKVISPSNRGELSARDIVIEDVDDQPINLDDIPF